MARMLAETSALPISFMTFPLEHSLLEGGVPSDDAGIDIRSVAHTRFSVVAEQRNDARHRTAYRRNPVQSPAAAEQQQCARLDLDRAHRSRTAVYGGGYGRIILIAVAADIGREIEGPTGLRGLQQDRHHEVVEIEMPAVRVALVHDGR